MIKRRTNRKKHAPGCGRTRRNISRTFVPRGGTRARTGRCPIELLKRPSKSWHSLLSLLCRVRSSENSPRRKNISPGTVSLNHNDSATTLLNPETSPLSPSRTLFTQKYVIINQIINKLKSYPFLAILRLFDSMEQAIFQGCLFLAHVPGPWAIASISKICQNDELFGRKSTKMGVFKSENVLDHDFERHFNYSLAHHILRDPNLELGRRRAF
jgi:hypothetical protein